MSIYLVGDLDVPNGCGARGTMMVYAATDRPELAIRCRDAMHSRFAVTVAAGVPDADAGKYVGRVARLRILMPDGPTDPGIARLEE